MTPPRPTAAQTRIMRRAVHSGGACFVRGAEVAAARAIVRTGCATLNDDGAIPGDGERWWFVITAAGRAALSAATGSKP